MNYLSGIVTNAKKFAANINTATFTGAIDIVFIRQEDGTYKSTPFYVRFGKLGAVNAREKIVSLEINEQEITPSMVLDDYGVAHFKLPTTVSAQQSFVELSEGKPMATGKINTFANVKMDRTDSKTEFQDVREVPRLHATINPSGRQRCEMMTPTDNLEKYEQSPEERELAQMIAKANSLVLTEAQLEEEYNLKVGNNKATFSITTQFQGTTSCACNIYVWSNEDKIIISDIDGTITKSDVRGMILPFIGVNSWTQGEVANLYNKISNNGYKILYLSARSISQAAATRTYIAGMQQGELKLPEGPVFLNPESALKAFKKEVIDGIPEVFKISCLTTLKDLFPSGSQPFYAGYGNRPNDIVAYTAVGIPSQRIFIINKQGELSVSHGKDHNRSSYAEQSTNVNSFFPPIHNESHLRNGVDNCLEYCPVALTRS